MELVLGNQLYIAKEGLHPGLRNRLLRLAAFQNPEFYKAQAMRLSTYNKPRVVGCAEDLPHHIGLPRGCLDDVRKLLAELGVGMGIRDERHDGSSLELTFQGELRPEQKTAADAILRHETGVLAATTAFGKTVVAAWLIARRGVNALVLVHRRQLLDQWVERLSTFLDIPTRSIGRIGGGRSRPTGRVDVGIIQSLVRKGVVSDIVADYGHVIIDECHHLSAHSFEQVARQAKARFVLGLSATVARKDGHHPIIFMQCGPVRHQVNARAQAASRPFEHFVLVQPTPFQPNRNPDPDKRVEFHVLYQELIDDQARTRRICEDVIDSVRNGRSPLILTERNDHLDRFEKELATRVDHVVVLRASVGKKQRRAINDRLAAIPRHEGRVIIATGKYFGEGFDDPRLDTLFLTLPVSWRGTVAQYAQLAMSRVLQWVAPRGVVSNVRMITCSTWSSVTVRTAPGRGSSYRPSSRYRMKRPRHLQDRRWRHVESSRDHLAVGAVGTRQDDPCPPCHVGYRSRAMRERVQSRRCMP